MCRVPRADDSLRVLQRKNAGQQELAQIPGITNYGEDERAAGIVNYSQLKIFAKACNEYRYKNKSGRVLMNSVK